MTQTASFSSFPLLLSQIITNTVTSNDRNLLAYISGGQKPKMGVTGVKSRYRAVFLMDTQGEGPFPYLFQLPEDSYVTWLTALHHFDLSHSHLSSSDFDSLPFSFARTIVITLD